MGARLTENKKRSNAALLAAYRCLDCITEIEVGDGLQQVTPYQFCARHGCSATTRRGSRCQNAATYPEAGVCGIHHEPE
jgi:hypothetical protein